MAAPAHFCLGGGHPRLRPWGLYAVQRPHIGPLGSVGYAYAYVVYTATVLLALVGPPADWEALVGG